MFFNSFYDLFRVVVVGTCAYVGLILLLRVSGKRTLAKMNAFDFVVTVALGSTLATALLSKDVALAEGLTAFATLILLQYVIAWLSVRSATVRKLVKSEPALIFYQGQFLDSVLKRERVTPDEVRAAVRSQGVATMDNVEGVVLETDGSFSVVKSADQPTTALQGVSNYPMTDGVPSADHKQGG